MPDIAIDFGSVAADAYTAIKPGKYPCTVTTVSMGQSDKEDSHPYLKFELRIDDTDENFGGRSLFNYASLSPKSLGRTKALFESFGVDVSGSVKMKVDDSTSLLIEPDLTGEACSAQVKAEMYEGEARAKVSRLLGNKKAPTSSNGTPATAGAKYK